MHYCMPSLFHVTNTYTYVHCTHIQVVLDMEKRNSEQSNVTGHVVDGLRQDLVRARDAVTKLRTSGGRFS